VAFADQDTTNETVLVTILDDTLVEGPETVSLSLGAPTGGATIGAQNTATLTILDNDGPGQIAFSSGVYSVNENGSPIAPITVVRQFGKDGPVAAALTFTGGTATPGTPPLVFPE